jgi:hypothetical protein
LKKSIKPPTKKEKQGEKTPTGMSPRNMEACHNLDTALVESIAKIITQSTMNI